LNFRVDQYIFYTKMSSNIMYFPCDPEMFEGRTQIAIAVPKKRALIKPKGAVPYYPATIGAEVDDALKEWYGARGLPVPADEVGIGAVIDAANAAEDMAFLDAFQKGEEEMGEVPAYGTPEFWDYHRKKKAAENAKRAAEGLPPLPTKKELEAAKAERKAAREAKKAGKAKVDDLTAGMAALKIK
jgi:hypothetical protein